MSASTSPSEHALLLSRLLDKLCTRSVSHFAAEARLDGESLRQALERYDIDYAWHVLSSDRLRDETIARLETCLRQPASSAQVQCISTVLRDAAAAQSPELLMSFDNDVASDLASLLQAQHDVSREAQTIA